MKRPVFDRRAIRLKSYDYTTDGAYFITVCTRARERLFGRIDGFEMELNVAGDIVSDEWLRTAQIRRGIISDAFLVMQPRRWDNRRCRRRCPQGRMAIRPHLGAYRSTPLRLESPSKTGGFCHPGFRSAVAMRVNALRHTPGLPER